MKSKYTQYYVGLDGSDDAFDTIRDGHFDTQEAALAWARMKTCDGNIAYVFDLNDNLLDRRFWEKESCLKTAKRKQI
jgi:hypothetical protein